MLISTKNTTLVNHFQQYGFAEVKNILDSVFCQEIYHYIHLQLTKYQASHGDIEENLYYSAVNRWPLQNLIPQSLFTVVQQKILGNLTKWLKQSFSLFEADVLYKSPIAPLGTPCHQDISYAWQRPYFFSVWIALTEVTTLDSAMQFLPGSHQTNLLPAIDFWQPQFFDEMRHSLHWQQHAKTCPADIGDGLWFSSRIWHGTTQQILQRSRYALVLRWGNEASLAMKVPKPTVQEFGMWNCGEITYHLLQKGLQKLSRIYVEDFEEMIIRWQYIINNNLLPFDCDQSLTLRSLLHLQLLHQAHQAYQGGDGQGIVYANLWQHLLQKLKIYLQQAAC